MNDTNPLSQLGDMKLTRRDVLIAGAVSTAAASVPGLAVAQTAAMPTPTAAAQPPVMAKFSLKVKIKNKKLLNNTHPFDTFFHLTYLKLGYLIKMHSHKLPTAFTILWKNHGVSTAAKSTASVRSR